MTLQTAIGDYVLTEGGYVESPQQWGRNWIPVAPKTTTKTVTVEEYDKDGKMVKKTITTTVETETPPASPPYPQPRYPYTITHDNVLGR